MTTPNAQFPSELARNIRAASPSVVAVLVSNAHSVIGFSVEAGIIHDIEFVRRP